MGCWLTLSITNALKLWAFAVKMLAIKIVKKAKSSLFVFIGSIIAMQSRRTNVRNVTVLETVRSVLEFI
jgi:hypothetical protein